MNVIDTIEDKCYIKQWDIGLCKGNIEELLKEGLKNNEFRWIHPSSKTQVYADPFILPFEEEKIKIVFEHLDLRDGCGNISLATTDKDYNNVQIKTLLHTGKHLSYPFVFVNNEITYIIPESSSQHTVEAYPFNQNRNTPAKIKKLISGEKLLDSTILYYNHKYWLFATKSGKHSNSDLYIYYANQLEGPYEGHHLNPVKKSLNGSRPAGNFISYNGEWFRPSQNNKSYYGQSVTIHRIIVLNELEFLEEPIVEIKPPGQSKDWHGIHTINLHGDTIVIDRLRRIFSPIDSIKIFVGKMAHVLKSLIPNESICTISLQKQLDYFKKNKLHQSIIRTPQSTITRFIQSTLFDHFPKSLSKISFLQKIISRTWHRNDID